MKTLVEEPNVAYVHILFADVACVNIGAKKSYERESMLLLSTAVAYNLGQKMRRRKKSYHHKHLREALLHAAIQLIAELGPTAFTLREAARRAGVSHNAPYRHFRDKEELLAAVSGEGFRELDRAMLDAIELQSDTVDRLKRAGLAYVDFALRRPQHFAVMFDAPLSKRKHPASVAAGEQAFGTLVSLVKGCQDEGRLPAGSAHPFALLAWSMVHGIAKLATAKRLPFGSKSDLLDFARFVIDQSLPVQSGTRVAQS